MVSTERGEHMTKTTMAFLGSAAFHNRGAAVSGSEHDDCISNRVRSVGLGSGNARFDSLATEQHLKVGAGKNARGLILAVSGLSASKEE